MVEILHIHKPNMSLLVLHHMTSHSRMTNLKAVSLYTGYVIKNFNLRYVNLHFECAIQVFNLADASNSLRIRSARNTWTNTKPNTKRLH